MITAAFDELSPVVGVKPACDLLGHSRAGHYRRPTAPGARPVPQPRPAPPNALTAEERAQVLEVLHQPEHVDLAVSQVWARLLDVGVYLCSIATMYRILRDARETRERRRQRTHPAKTKPQLQARRPNPVRFTIEDARSFCATFFEYYNHQHRHSGIGLHTAASVHYGTANQIRELRQQTLDAAYAANPDRFSHRRPTPPELPTVAWINQPTPRSAHTERLTPTCLKPLDKFRTGICDRGAPIVLVTTDTVPDNVQTTLQSILDS